MVSSGIPPGNFAKTIPNKGTRLGLPDGDEMLFGKVQDLATTNRSREILQRSESPEERVLVYMGAKETHEKEIELVQAMAGGRWPHSGSRQKSFKESLFRRLWQQYFSTWEYL